MKLKVVVHKADEGGFWVEVPVACMAKHDDLQSVFLCKFLAQLD